MNMTFFSEILKDELEENKIAYVDYSDYDENLELIDDSFYFEVFVKDQYGVAFPIKVIHNGEDENDLELRMSIVANEEKQKELIDLCNYLMAHYVYLRWVLTENFELDARYNMTLSKNEAENVPRTIHHLKVFSQVLNEVYPMVQRALWED